MSTESDKKRDSKFSLTLLITLFATVFIIKGVNGAYQVDNVPDCTTCITAG